MPTSRTKRTTAKQKQLDDSPKLKMTREMVNKFADVHPRFDELGRVIEMFIKGGLDLEKAYQAAVIWDALKKTPKETLKAAIKRMGKRANAKQNQSAGRSHAGSRP